MQNRNDNPPNTMINIAIPSLHRVDENIFDIMPNN
jgi:hypothetical protein